MSATPRPQRDGHGIPRCTRRCPLRCDDHQPQCSLQLQEHRPRGMFCEPQMIADYAAAREVLAAGEAAITYRIGANGRDWFEQMRAAVAKATQEQP